jgi:hypothetical protein
MSVFDKTDGTTDGPIYYCLVAHLSTNYRHESLNGGRKETDHVNARIQRSTVTATKVRKDNSDSVRLLCSVRTLSIL